MVLQNDGDQSFTNNGTGWTLGGGAVPLTLTIAGGNITITGANSNVYTYPGATSTLASLGLAETFTANKLFSAGLNVSGGNLVVTGGTFVIGTLTTGDVLQYNGTNIVNAGLTFNSLSDVIVTSPIVNQVVQYNGTNWVNSVPNATGGFINKFRNAPMSIWSRGTSGTITAGTANAAYSADGWILSCTGANVTWAQGTTGVGNTKFLLQITGTTGVTDTLIKQRIESIDVAPLTSDLITVQARIINNTGASITPTLTINHATVADTFSTVANEMGPSNLQAIPNGSTAVVAYTLTTAAGAANGLEVIWDFGAALNAVTKSISISELDIRLTPGAAAGTNNNPPVPELPYQTVEIKRNSRFLPAYNATGTNQSIATGYATSATSGTYYFQFLTSTRVPVTGVTATASNFRSEGQGNGTVALTGISFYKGGPKAGLITGTAASGLVAGPQILEFGVATGSIIFTGAEL